MRIQQNYNLTYQLNWLLYISSIFFYTRLIKLENTWFYYCNIDISKYISDVLSDYLLYNLKGEQAVHHYM